MAEEVPCSKCSRSVDPAAMERCPNCYKLVCSDCRYATGGRYFCSSQCAHYYYFADEEEDA